MATKWTEEKEKIILEEVEKSMFLYIKIKLLLMSIQ